MSDDFKNVAIVSLDEYVEIKNKYIKYQKVLDNINQKCQDILSEDYENYSNEELFDKIFYIYTDICNCFME